MDKIFNVLLENFIYLSQFSSYRPCFILKFCFAHSVNDRCWLGLCSCERKYCGFKYSPGKWKYCGNILFCTSTLSSCYIHISFPQPVVFAGHLDFHILLVAGMWHYGLSRFRSSICLIHLWCAISIWIFSPLCCLAPYDLLCFISQGINFVHYENEHRTEWCSNNSTRVPCFLFARKFSRGGAVRLLGDGVVGPFDASVLSDTAPWFSSMPLTTSVFSQPYLTINLEKGVC